MAVDFAALFQTFYPPGAGVQYISPAGNDGNPGTAGSRKRTIAAAQSALGGGGGIIWCANGAYDPNTTVSGTYSSSARLLIMAETIEGPTITCSANHGIVISGQGIGLYGFLITGNGDTGSFVFQKCIQIGGGSRNVSVWKNTCIKGCEAGIGVPSQGQITDYFDICYNTVIECGRWFYSAGSGISMYECREADTAAGPHINVIGNRCYHNYNNTDTANTDGNGIIIDDFSNTQYDNHVNNSLVVVHGNLCVDNGGRGTHSPWTPNVHHSFNTSAENMWQVASHSQGGESALGGSTSRAYGNVTYPNPSRGSLGQTWSQYFRDTYGGAIVDNTALGGSSHGGDPSVRNRTSDGKNYFKNNAPTLAPRTLGDADQWRPDGASGTIEKTVLSQSDYDRLSKWPDMFGDYRPARTVGWAHGFAEGASNASPNAPVAAFTYSPTSPRVGQAIVVTDNSSNGPTSWSYNWGDGTGNSTTQNPSHTYTTAGNFTITLTATNSAGSGTKTQTIVASNVVTPPTTNRELVDFNVANRTGFPPSNYGHGWGHQELLLGGATGGGSSVVSNKGRQITGGGGSAGYSSIIDDLQADFSGDFDLYVDCTPGFTRSDEAYMGVSFCASNNRSLWDWRLLDGYELRIYGLAAVPIKIHSTPSSDPGSDTVVHDTTYNSWSAGDTIHIRIRRVGTNLRVYLWKNAEAQPASPVTNITTTLWSGPAIALGTGTGSPTGGQHASRTGDWDNLLILTGDQIGGTGAPGTLPTVETSNPGYTGSGYVNMNAAGEGVRFTNLTAPNAGTFAVNFRYQNITATICELKVNGVVVDPSMTLPATGTSFASSSWGSAGLQTQLQAGLNDVQLKYVSGGELHLDSVKVGGDVVTPPPPPSTNTLPIIGANSPGHLVSATDQGNNTYVITYQMTGHNGTLINATGIAVKPSGTAPSGGWRVVTVGHGATGASDDAAPSLQTGSLKGQINGNVGNIDALLSAGFVVVMADYEGLGGQANWRHPYMYGISAGRSLIDAARACAGLPNTKINNRLASWGFSQGGHAALWCGELVNSSAYGTEFQCVTVALDPVIPTEYVSSQWQSAMFYGLLNTYGQWVADNSLPLTSVADGTAIGAMTGGSDYYGQGSLFVNPTTPSQWAAAFRKTDPGYRNGGRVLHWEAQYGIGAQQAYVNRAAGFGTVLDHRIAYGSGHDSNFTQQVQAESLNWVNAAIPAP